MSDIDNARGSVVLNLSVAEATALEDELEAIKAAEGWRHRGVSPDDILDKLEGQL